MNLTSRSLDTERTCHNANGGTIFTFVSGSLANDLMAMLREDYTMRREPRIH